MMVCFQWKLIQAKITLLHRSLFDFVVGKTYNHLGSDPAIAGILCLHEICYLPSLFLYLSSSVLTSLSNPRVLAQISVYILHFNSVWRHSIVSNSSTRFINSNRFEFMNTLEEFETIEWTHVFWILVRILYQNTRRMIKEFKKNSARIQNSS